MHERVQKRGTMPCPCRDHGSATARTGPINLNRAKKKYNRPDRSGQLSPVDDVGRLRGREFPIRNGSLALRFEE
jgi:hypothetical protein